MSILIDKPQFNTEVIKQGKAIEITILNAKRKGFKTDTVKKDALIGKVYPLMIVVWYCDWDNEGSLKSVQINVEQIGVDYEINRLTYYTK